MSALEYYEKKAGMVDIDRWTSVLLPVDARSILQSLGQIAVGNLRKNPLLSQLMSALSDLSASPDASESSQQMVDIESLFMGSLLAPTQTKRLVAQNKADSTDAAKKVDDAWEYLTDCPAIVRNARAQISKESDPDLRSDLDRLTVEIDRCLAVRTKVQGGRIETATRLVETLADTVRK